MSDKLGGYTESDVTPYTEEERALSLAAWAFDLLTEKSTLREALTTVKVHRYDATLRQREAECHAYEQRETALMAALAEMTRERDELRRQVRALTCQRDGLLEQVGAEAEMAPCPGCPLEDLCHVPEVTP